MVYAILFFYCVPLANEVLIFRSDDYRSRYEVKA